MARVTMSAAVLHGPGDLRVEQRGVPEPGPGDVLVEVSHCGICGTDLHMVVEGWGRPGSVGGHEWSGTIVAVGSDVSSFRVGDRELVEPLDVGLDDLLDAMHALAAGRIAGKVLVAPNARGGRP